jgi:hypothetical protein
MDNNICILIVSGDQNARQHCNVKIATLLFEIMAKFKYVGRTPTHQTLMYEEIKRKSSKFVTYKNV